MRSRLSISVVTAIAAAVLAAPSPSGASFGWLAQFGDGGVAEGQFSVALGAASDSQGNVYVADRNNYRIQKFDPNGNFVRTWGWGVQDGSNAFQVCTGSCRAGLGGAGDGQFKYPVDVTVDSSGFVYVVEGPGGPFNVPGNNRVQKFDGNGNFVTTWGGDGPAEGRLGIPLAIAVDSSDRLYVAEPGNNRVSKFDSSGAFERMWGWGVDDGSSVLQVCTSGCQAGLSGYGAGQFLQIFGIAVAPSGQIYTLDNGSHRVQRWDGGGGLFAEFDADEGPDGYSLVAIELDTAGFVYIATAGNGSAVSNALRRFTADGVLTDRIPCNNPANGIAAHPTGKLFVTSDTFVRIVGDGGSECQAPTSPPPPGGGGGGEGGGTGLTFAGNEGVTINDGARYTNDPDVVLKIVAPAVASSVRLANDGGFAAAVTRAIAADRRYAWTLDRDPDKDERLPKTVYVRFTGPGGDSALTFTDDIILDTVPPTVSQASLSGGSAGTSGALAARSRRFTISVRARDRNSGLGQLQLAANKRKPAKPRAFKTKLVFRASMAPRYVRVRDRAGNFSKWRKLRTRK